jgi:hypothetical protein
MKIKPNIVLLKLLLKYDFFFFNKRSSIIIKPPLTVLKNFKQIIRVLQYSKTTGSLNFYGEPENLIFSFLSRYLPRGIFLKNAHKCYGGVGSIFFSSKQTTLKKYKILLRGKSCICIEIDSSTNSLKNFGSYKFIFDTNNYKKLIFFYSVLIKIFK